MLNGVKMRNLYSKLQTQLFYMIPEKWDKICLYAAIIKDENNEEKMEMFFYYYPSGVLKKNPINVYEISSKFNIDEDDYMKLVNNLCETIKMIKQEFRNAGDKLWTNLTILIENLKFHIEYDYENLSNYTNDERHIIWQYKYLNLIPEKLPKKQRKMLEEYILQSKFKNKEIKEHTENMYEKKVHNIIEYDREENVINQEEEAEKQRIKKEKIKKQKVDNKNVQKTKLNGKKIDKYELYKMEQEEKKKDKYELYKIEKQTKNYKKEIQNEQNYEKEVVAFKNQILSI